MRRWAFRAVVLALATFAIAGLWSAASSRPSDPGGDTRAVAGTLRCPTCVAESVADSTAPLAAGMRAVIEEQLGQGRTPDEIRAWFVQRYGEQVLLEPPRRGLGMALWLLPLVLAPAAAWWMARGPAGRRRTAGWIAAGCALVGVGMTAWLMTDVAGDRSPAVVAPASTAHPIAVLQHAAERSPGDLEIRATLARALERAGRIEDAAEQYRAAVRLAPQDETLAYRAAFALTRSGQRPEATVLLEGLLARSPQHAEGLLLLGTLRHDEADPRADDLLRRFIDVAPEHPAVEQARGMLNGGD